MKNDISDIRKSISKDENDIVKQNLHFILNLPKNFKTDTP